MDRRFGIIQHSSDLAQAHVAADIANNSRAKAQVGWCPGHLQLEEIVRDHPELETMPVYKREGRRNGMNQDWPR
jgi:hypothetical protein